MEAVIYFIITLYAKFICNKAYMQNLLKYQYIY